MSDENPGTKRAGISVPKKPRGFQLMAYARLQEIASMGGRRAHELGVAHRFTKDNAREHGRQGGLKRQALARQKTEG